MAKKAELSPKWSICASTPAPAVHRRTTRDDGGAAIPGSQGRKPNGHLKPPA